MKQVLRQTTHPDSQGGTKTGCLGGGRAQIGEGNEAMQGAQSESRALDQPQPTYQGRQGIAAEMSSPLPYKSGLDDRVQGNARMEI